MVSKATDALVSYVQNTDFGKVHFENNEHMSRSQLYFISFVIGNMTQVIYSYCEPRLLNLGYYKNMVKWCLMTENDWEIMGHFHNNRGNAIKNWHGNFFNQGAVLNKKNMAL
jgi:hypothetical protein